MFDLDTVDFRFVSRPLALRWAAAVPRMREEDVVRLLAVLRAQTGGLSPGNDLTPLYRAALDRLGIEYRIERHMLPKLDNGEKQDAVERRPNFGQVRPRRDDQPVRRPPAPGRQDQLGLV